uniref:Uncharacterized protein n=1 Tax=Meleagris gallopavo TaxID=9103 RepID=A0A803XT30_MELGA
IQGQAGCGSGQPGLVVSDPAYSRGAILKFFDFLGLVVTVLTLLLKQEQAYVRDEFGKILERERISSNEHLTRAILRERAATEEERQKAQRFARQLEEKDRELKKHDAYYKEQLARLEERSAQFYKVTTEQYQKAADEVSARFNVYVKSLCWLMMQSLYN